MMQLHNALTISYNACRENNGYATLLSVVVVGAVTASVAVSLLLLGIQSEQTAAVDQRSEQARAFADACIEEALQEIRDDASFAGSETLEFDSGDCQYAVSDNGGQSRVIEATGQVSQVTQKVRAETDGINPEITITSWQSVADF